MGEAPEIKVEEILPRQEPTVPEGKDGGDAFGLARAAESFRHGIVDTTRIREQEKTLRETNTHKQKMLELEHAEAERKRTFRSNWIIAGAFCFFQLLIAAYGFKSNNVTYVLTAANGFAGFFVSRKF